MFTLYVCLFQGKSCCTYILALRSHNNVEETLACDTLFQCENKNIYEKLLTLYSAERGML